VTLTDNSWDKKTFEVVNETLQNHGKDLMREFLPQS
jgi:hypothetical protein